MYRKVLVAYDGSASADAALRAALDLSRSAPELTLATLAVEPDALPFAARSDEIAELECDGQVACERLQARAVAEGAQRGVRVTTMVATGDPAEQIVHCAQEGNFDLIILGRKHHSRVREYAGGTTVEHVLRHASCDVLIAHADVRLS